MILSLRGLGQVLTILVILVSVVVVQAPAAGKEKAGRAAEVDESASSALTIQVTPQVAFEGSPVQATIHVPQHAENRKLRVIVDSEHYFRSGDIPLDGDDSATTHVVPLQSLPAGEYEVSAVVYGPSRERARIQRTFRMKNEEFRMQN